MRSTVFETKPRLSIENLEARLTPDSSIGLSPQTMITGLYRQILQRDPETSGLAAQILAVEAGRTASQVADSLYNSREFRSAQVDSYYQVFLGREPNELDREVWTDKLLAGATEQSVQAAFAGSKENYQQCDKNNTVFVHSLYVSLLGREADSQGLQAHVNRLNEGVAPQVVAAAFTESKEFRKVKIDIVYRVALGREALDQTLNVWQANWDKLGGLPGITSQILGSQENLAVLGQTGGVGLPDLVQAANLRQILEAPYTEGDDGFVKLYNQLVQPIITKDNDGNDVYHTPPGNEALWLLTKNGGWTDGLPDDEKHVLTVGYVPVQQLLPTQNEVDFHKSLDYPLTDPEPLDLYLNGGNVIHPGGVIMTGNDGKFILDGHHRWSTIFVINPDIQIGSMDLGYEESPQDLLKKLQMAVGAQTGGLPYATVAPGSNLFTMDQPTFNANVEATINGGTESAKVMAVFAKHGIADMDAVKEYLWNNVLLMRLHNTPVPGATGRGFMPQPPENNYSPVNLMISLGQLNFRFPVIPRLG